MTNVNSGFKRAWDGTEIEPHKRPRSREEPKDWKDVHLRSPTNRVTSDRRHTRDYDSDRRAGPDRRPDRRDRDSDYRRTAEHGRAQDRSRRRDDREREKEKYRVGKDENFYRDHSSMSRTQTVSPKSPKSANGHVPQPRDDSEREEGE
jgi:serine/threonine-protein kinase PRP4